MMEELTARLLRHLPEAADAPDAGGELEVRLQHEIQVAEASCGLVSERLDDFLAFIADRLDGPGDLIARLDRLRVADLALAWGCLQGDTAALERLEREQLSVVELALARVPAAAKEMDEVKQRLREQLLVPEPHGQPRLAQYRGRGDLRSWLRVIALRKGLDLVRGGPREVALSEQILDQMTSPEDPELQPLKRLYRGEFKGAFERAVEALAPRDRNLLRYFYLDELNIDQIGTIFNVHRSTVARWLVRIRDELLRGTRQLLMQRLKVDRGEFESIMRMISSQLEASIGRLL